METLPGIWQRWGRLGSPSLEQSFGVERERQRGVFHLLDLDLGQSVAAEAQFLGGTVGNVQDTVFDERPTVIDAHIDELLIAQVRDLHPSPQRKGEVGGSELVHVKMLT